jgi:hypothetical protein
MTVGDWQESSRRHAYVRAVAGIEALREGFGGVNILQILLVFTKLWAECHQGVSTTRSA